MTTLPHGITLETFQAARDRIKGRVVHTPLVRLHQGTVPRGSGVDDKGILSCPVIEDRLGRDSLLLKLECMQVTGSFKARGAMNRLLSLPPGIAARGIITASGGNHGLAVAFAGRSLRVPTIVYLPKLTSIEKAKRIERWGATVLRAGDVWDDAHAAALEHAKREGLTYIHPFADPEVVAGQGTISLEILEHAPNVDLLVVAIGGGGLIAGIAAAAKLLRPNLKVIGVEPTGAPTLYESLKANKVIELDAITTKAGTLAPRRSDPYTFEIIRAVVDEIVLVTDDEMREAARFLLINAGIGVELSGAAAVAAVITGRIPDLRSDPCILVCGNGHDALPHS
jgi:threonine dehydratase